MIADHDAGPSGKGRTSLVFSAPNRPGAIQSLLEPMARHGVEQGWAGQLENAGAKMFANKLLFIASAAGLPLFLADTSVLWQVPCAAPLIFSTLEWAFSFCIACWAYGIWYRYFPSHA